MIKIGKNKISIKHIPYIIVEACVNHQGNFSIAKKMIYAAKVAGAQCIKFQHHIVKEEMLEKNIPKIEDTNIKLNKNNSFIRNL